MVYWEFQGSDYTKIRNNLLNKERSALRTEFLKAAKDREYFVEWMDEHIGLEKNKENNAVQFQLFADQVTEGEYNELPIDIEKKLFDKWKNLTPKQGSQETFWGYVTLEHIRRGVIKSHFLAGTSSTDGLERIDKALYEGDSKKLDDVVRTVLRRLSGLPEARGARSVYVNCPFARAWWRGYVADEVRESTKGKADARKVAETLSSSQSYWEELISLVVSRNSVLGDSNVRSALIWALAEYVDDKTKDHLFTNNGIKKVSREIGIRSAWQELGVFPVDRLKQIMQNEFL